MSHKYETPNFIFHIFEDNGEITIGLASNYVYPPTNKNELKNLIEFIGKHLDDNNSNTNHNA